MPTVDPDHISPDAKILVQSPTETHEVTGEWWNEYVTKAKLAGVALANRIIDTIEAGTLPRPGEQVAPPEATRPTPVVADAPPAPVE